MKAFYRCSSRIEISIPKSSTIINEAAFQGYTNVTALLLNYKNEHFADFDPMEEFPLEEL